MLAANYMLLAFQGEVSAQAGKAIGPDHATLLMRLAEALKQ